MTTQGGRGGPALAGEVAAGGDPRADIRETKRRERAMVVAALDDYEAWIESRHLRAAGQTMSALRRGLGHLLQRDLARTSTASP